MENYSRWTAERLCFLWDVALRLPLLGLLSFDLQTGLGAGVDLHHAVRGDRAFILALVLTRPLHSLYMSNALVQNEILELLYGALIFYGAAVWWCTGISTLATGSRSFFRACRRVLSIACW